MFDFKFFKKQLLPGIDVIKLQGRDAIVGYTIYFDAEGAWTWVRKDNISSQFYKTEQEACEALATYTMLEKLDNNAKKIGIFNNENFVKGRNDINEAKL
jgi:hypothetical protein